MPYLATIVPQIAAEDKDKFLAAWPAVAAQIKALPTVAGLSAGPILAENSAPVTEFKFLETISFKTLEDQKAFEESDIVKEGAKKYAEKAGPPAHATFEVEAFPDHASPSPLVSFNRIIISDPSKGLAAKAAWEKVTAVLGKKAFGGKAVGDGPSVGLALLGWDSTEELTTATAKPEFKAAWEEYKACGDVNSTLVQLTVY